MKNRFNRLLSFLLIVATLCSFLPVFTSAASEVDASVKMFYNRSFNEGWDHTNGLGTSNTLTPYVNHEYDDDYNYNYFLEVTEGEEQILGGKLSLTIPNANIPTTGKTVFSFRLKLPSESNQNYGTIIQAKTKPGTEYNLLTVNANQVYCLDTMIGTIYNDEWVEFEFVMNWEDGANRVCNITIEGGGLSTTTTLPLVEGQFGASLQYVYIGMGSRTMNEMVRDYRIDDVLFYNTAQNIIAKEDLHLYGVGALVKETVAKTVSIYGETLLAPTDYIKAGLTMKVNVPFYMTDVVVDQARGTKAHKQLHIYDADNGEAYGAPVKYDGVVYVPLDLILAHLGYEYKIRENSVEFSTGGTNSVCITFGSTSASVNGERVELAGAPRYAVKEIEGKEYPYIVIPMDNVETFFAQEGSENPLYVTYDDMGLILLTAKDNVWNRSENLTDMAVLMEKFVFEYDYDNKGVGFGEKLIADMEAYSKFQHPYLFANQDRFDTLRAVWLSNDQAAYDKLMALTAAEKEAFGIGGADPEGYSDTLRDWLREKQSIGANDPEYIFVNGEYDPDTHPNKGVNTTTRAEMLYIAGNAWLILDSEGNYLGMNPGSGEVGFMSYRGGLVNKNLVKNGGNYTDGYDAGGRFSLNTGSLVAWGFSYQLTRDLRYAQIAFDWISILGDTAIWEHWGPTHFLNTADGTSNVANAYDWLCPAWDALKEQGVARPTNAVDVYKVYDGAKGTNLLYYMTAAEYAALGLPTPTEKTVVVKLVDKNTGEVSFATEERALTESQKNQKITNTLHLTPPSFPEVTTYERKHLATIIMNQGVHEGWLAEKHDMTDHPSVRCLGGFEWKSNTDNWNAVCTKGMALGAMMAVEYEEFRTECIEMIDIMMYYFFVNGLDEYAPDGAYYESASYWSYGTNAAFMLAAAYESATGRDYGIMNSYGMDRTCYFAANVESSDAHIWTYNDAGGGGNAPSTSGMDTGWFMWVGQFINDPGIIEHRVYQLENGLKSASYYDIFCYKPEYSGVESINLPLSYYMEGLKTYCGAYSVRSSWEKGAMCISMIGGTNAVAHADVDAGAFMYWNGGHGWIWDLGADNYNLYSFFGASYSGTNLPNRFRYYRHGAEGNNCVVLASRQDVLPFGQRVKGVAPLKTQYSDEHGAYAIYEMLDIYSADPELAGTKTPLVSGATRGVLATDDYQTAIVQDEIISKTMETFYWFAHFSDYTINATLSEDGRVCYMSYKTADRDENGEIIRYPVLRLTIVSPDSADKFYITDTGDDAMIFDATFRYGTHQNYPDQLENQRDHAQRLCIKRERKTNFRVAVVFEMLPDAFYNPKTGVVDVAGGQDTYPCSYKWTNMFNWSTKAAVDTDFGDEEDDKTEIETLAVTDIVLFSNAAKALVEAGNGYTEKYYELFNAISYTQRVWDKWGQSEMVKPFEQGYRDIEDYIRAVNRIARQVNTNDETARKMGETLAGLR